jgi:uncharacterized membrane protein
MMQRSPFEGYDIHLEPVSEDPPLLEELGINPTHIKQKAISVLLGKHVEAQALEDPDMAGPMVIVMLFGMLLLMAGKAHFGYIYGFGVLGCTGIYCVVNLMSQDKQIDLYHTVSILGYAFLPVVLLSILGVFYALNSKLGGLIGLSCVLWSTLMAAKFFETVLDMKNQRWLVAYPLALLYSVFALITIF